MRKLWVFLTLSLSLMLASTAFAADKKAAKWNLSRLPVLQEAVAGTTFELHELEDALLIKVYAAGTFNPERPELLLPSALSKVGQLGRHLAADQELSILVLGMSAEQKNSIKQQEISHARAKSLASILRLNKISTVRMQAFGVGASPQAGPELAASILIVPVNELPTFAAHFRETPIFLAHE